MLVKVMQGRESALLEQEARLVFKQRVKWVKPPSSRSSSREVYLLCEGYCGAATVF